MKKILFALFFLVLFTSLTNAWFNTTWQYRNNVTINSGVSTTLENFPIRVNINTQTLITNGLMRSNCVDIRVVNNTDLNTSLMDFEIENATCNTLNTILWVRIPNLTSGNYLLHVYFGNNTPVSSGQNRTGVWRPAQYGGVWHFGNDLIDSLEIHNATGTTGYVDSFLGRAVDFSVGNDLPFSTPDARPRGLPQGDSQRASSAWVTGTGTSLDFIFAYGSGGSGSNPACFGIGFGIPSVSGDAVTMDTWAQRIEVAYVVPNVGQYYSWNYAANNYTARVNNTQQGSDTLSLGLNNTASISAGGFGRRHCGVAFFPSTRRLLEFRFHNTTRTADWYSAEWGQNYSLATQESNGSFITIFSPLNGTTFRSTNVTLNVTTGFNATNLTFSVNGGANQTMCFNCTSAVNFTTISVGGTNNVTFYGFNSTGATITANSIFTISAFSFTNLSTNRLNYTEGLSANVSLTIFNITTNINITTNFTLNYNNGTYRSILRSGVSSAANISLSVLFPLGQANVSNLEGRNFTAQITSNVSDITEIPFGRNVTVARMILTNCSSGTASTTSALDMFVFDEATQIALNNATINTSFTVTTSGSVVNRDYGFNFLLTNRNNQSICLFPTDGTLDTNGTVLYERDAYSQRQSVIRTNLTNTTQTLNLYLLNSSTSSLVQVYVEDRFTRRVENVVVRAMRFFPLNNSYVTVAEAITDSLGQVSMQLQVSDTYYRFIALNYTTGQLLETFNSIIILCTDGSCPPYEITLRISTLTTPPFFEQFDTISGSCSLNNATAVLSCTVSDGTGGTSRTFRLRVDRMGATNFSNICNITCTSTTCILTCGLGNTTNNFYRYILTHETTGRPLNILEQDEFDFRTGLFTFGVEQGMFIGLIIVLLLFFAGIATGAGTALLFAAFGLIGLYMINAMPTDVTALIGLLVFIIIMVWKLRT